MILPMTDHGSLFNQHHFSSASSIHISFHSLAAKRGAAINQDDSYELVLSCFFTVIIMQINSITFLVLLNH
jgi:hypothetical protein